MNWFQELESRRRLFIYVLHRCRDARCNIWPPVGGWVSPHRTETFQDSVDCDAGIRETDFSRIARMLRTEDYGWRRIIGWIQSTEVCRGHSDEAHVVSSPGGFGRGSPTLNCSSPKWMRRSCHQTNRIRSNW